MTDEPTEKGKQEVLDEAIEVWRKSLWKAKLDVRIADVLGDAAGKEEAIKRVGDALTALDTLEKKRGGDKDGSILERVFKKQCHKWHFGSDYLGRNLLLGRG